MIRMIFLFCALLAALGGQAADEEAHWLESHNYTEVAQWMVQQPDAEMRAAGLLTLASEYPNGRGIEPDTYLQSMEQLLDESPSASVLFLLAHGCEQLDLSSECVDAGLDEAIIRNDGGNPLSRGALYTPGSDVFRDVLLAAESIDDHSIGFRLAWYDALTEYESDLVAEKEVLVASFSLASAIATPAYSHLVRICGKGVGEDEALDKACRRLATMMQQERMSVLARSVGLGMARSRAEALGQEELAAEYDEKGRAVMSEAASLAGHAHEALVEPEVQREFLVRWREEGELAAFRHLSELQGRD